MFTSICSIIFGVSVIYKLYSIEKGYEQEAKDKEYWSNSNEK